MGFIKISFIFILLLLPVLSFSEVTLHETEYTKIKGQFNLIVYSNSFYNDPETFIILDRADDKIEILPYAPSFKYKIFPNLNEKEALKVIGDVFNSPSLISFLNYLEIRDSGQSLGFDIKPVYFPWIFGITEPLETSYRKEGNTLNVYIRLNPRVERQINNGGNFDRDF